MKMAVNAVTVLEIPSFARKVEGDSPYFMTIYLAEFRLGNYLGMRWFPQG